MRAIDIELDSDYTFGKLLISWYGEDGYFGEIGIRTDGNEIYIDSEYMSRDSIKEILCEMVDVAVLEHEVKPQ